MRLKGYPTDGTTHSYVNSPFGTILSVPGVTGPRGFEGPEGPEGPQGPEGPEGPRGLQGERGLQGIEGPEGPRGKTGPEGPEGPEGPQGPKGDQGDDLKIDDTVSEYGDLPSSPGVGSAYVVTDDGLLYVYGPNGYPDQGEGINLRGPEGPKGPEGPEGPEGPQGLGGPAGTTSWNGLDDIPSDFPPEPHNHSAADITSGTVGYARLPVGSTANTIAAGDDARLSDERTPLNGSVAYAKCDVGVQASLDRADSAVEASGDAAGLWMGEEGDLPSEGEPGVLYVVLEEEESE